MPDGTKAAQQAAGASKRAHFDIQLDRHEAKYIVPANILPDVRRFIEPFCDPDPHGSGDPPEYVITTIQLDTPSLSLHHAKELEAVSRFKLRVRTYGKPGTSPVFLEVKRKVRGTIIKSRTSIPFAAWDADTLFKTRLEFNFKSTKEEVGFLEFARLTREIGARPVVLIRYTRESYFSTNDRYARVSFDHTLLYQPSTEWTNWGEGRHWYNMDSSLSQNKQYRFSGVIMELKTLSDTPHWMIDLVQHFDLARTGNCKYSTAIWQESMFRGTTGLAPYAADLLLF